MKPRSTIKSKLFDAECRAPKIDSLGDPLVKTSEMVVFAALTIEIDRFAPRGVSAKGGQPPFPTETMARILVLKRRHNLSGDQDESRLQARLSFQRFYGLTMAANIQDRTKVWDFVKRVRANGAAPLSDGLNARLLGQGSLTLGGQIIDATLVPAPNQHVTREERALINDRATPTDWGPAKRRPKDNATTWTKKHGKSYFGNRLPVNAARRYKPVRDIETDPARVHDGKHLDALVDRGNTNADAYPDRKYPGQDRESDLTVNGYRTQIQRRKTAKRKLSQCQQPSNHRIAKVCAGVRHVFAAIAQTDGKLIRTIGKASADFGITMMALLYKLKRLTYPKTDGIETF